MDNFDIYPEFKNPLGGRPLSYKPRELAEKFVEYIEWAKDHPIVLGETQEGTRQGKSFDVEVTKTKPRLISISGFLVYLGKRWTWWQELDKGKHGAAFLEVKDSVREYCEHYQTEMATVEVFNANIISRLLGLADKQEVDMSAEVKGVTVNVTSPETAQVLQDIMDKNNK
jgi:hypothetical protein